jgi:lipopolysaccharide transport system permease protein
MKKQHIRPSTFTSISFSELWAYRELFWSLSFRDFKVRYAQTSIGFLWAVLQPITYLVVLNVVFGKFAKVETFGIPHILFSTSGLICWTYFAYVMTNSGNSIIMSQAMIKKIYFPRIIVPVSKAIVGLIDLGIVALILVVLIIWFQIPISSKVLLVPIFIFVNMLGALGVGMWISALTVRYRDFQYIVPFMVQIGLYLSPVAFPSEYASQYLPKALETLYFLNPVVGVIDGIRWSLFSIGELGAHTFVSIGMSLALFLTGYLFFQKVENKIADLV